jgi:metallo-beta-lactamase class B
MKLFLYILIFSNILFGCSKVEFGNEVYKSENLSIIQLSKHTYQHISYMDARQFGIIPCNGMIVANKNEAVVFDTPIGDLPSSELIDWITETLKCKIIAVIPTHYHFDNLGGLNEFHRRGIVSYANIKTIEMVHEYLPIPQNGFDNNMELNVGNKKVYIEFFGEGHTIDNVIGYFPYEDIMFGGCLIKNLGDGEGNIQEANVFEWSETVRRIKAKYPNVKIILTGHGNVGGFELLDYTIDMFKKYEL